MEKEQPRLLCSRLFLKNRLVEVALNRSVLAWKETEKSRRRRSGFSSLSDTAHSQAAQVYEIVAVHEAEDNDTKRKDKRVTGLYPHAFTVAYVKRTAQHQWRCSDVTFRCASQTLCEQWIQVINEQLSLLTNRPKSLLVYINPYGGKRRGKHIYEQKVAPLFRRACISADVIVTERANHARDHLKTEANLDKYDGVVCVGGDGMFSEVLHGLVTRTQADRGVDQSDPDAELVPCDLRIGIIPAGSTDCICFATVGTIDPVTSALHVIVGDSQPMDVCSAHHNDTFLKYSVSLLGYGFYGDVLTDSERKRWLGPARYDLSGAKIFLNHNHYEGTVSFLPAEHNIGNPRDKLLCRSGCHVCLHKHSSKEKQRGMLEEKEASDKGDSGGWSVIHGKFVAINAASMSCACPRSPQGLSPSAHLADGTTDLILVRECSRLDFFKHLLRHTNKDDQFDHPFVEVHRVTKFRFQPRHQQLVSLEDLSETQKKADFSPVCSCQTTCSSDGRAHSSWSCDGEILHHAAIQVSVQCRLIRLFARGIEEQQQQQQQQQQPSCVFEDPCAPRAPQSITHCAD
ncbi:ceramide kinase [Solea senegalensis]|uniref:Ceramide kinase n=1 Tax=Solea senegalensis TaxID=28829 RepID=A0AAV6QXF9_SOLSE|nr:ceramide kinase [Solea senegalensis]KAG7497335.1 ceramide kinase [Solea senegalensis]